MTRAKPNYAPDPRIWNEYQVARLFNMSSDSKNWKDRRRELEASGFPKPSELLGGWDSEAIEVWIDMHSGLRDSHSCLADETMRSVYDQA